MSFEDKETKKVLKFYGFIDRRWEMKKSQVNTVFSYEPFPFSDGFLSERNFVRTRKTPGP